MLPVLLPALLWAFVLGLWPQAAQAQTLTPGKYVLSGISVEGAQFVEKQSIVALSGLVIGSEINVPGNELADAMKKLWKQKLFSDVQLKVDNVMGNKLFLVIQLAELPRISKFRFSGVGKSQADDLREKVKLVAGTILTVAKQRQTERIVKNFFAEKGHYNSTVTITADPDPNLPNAVLVTIDINRGPKVKVNKIYIDGNVDLSPKKLKGKFKDTKEKKIWRVWKRSKFIRAEYNGDKQKMLKYLNSQGFRDAQIVSDSVVLVNDKNVDIYLSIYEGQRYYYRNITWVGNNKYPTDMLSKVLDIKKGDVYDTEALDKKLQMDPNGFDIASLYLDDGYLFFRVEPVEINIIGDSVDIELRMFEGPQATYGKIIIEGNTKTSDHVILREIRTLPGNKFSRSELIRSQREIMALGYFSQENMNVVPIPDPVKGTVDIKYIVEERPSDQFFFQGGWGGRIRDQAGNVISGGLVLTVGVTFTNFSTHKMFKKGAWRPLPSGDGQRVSVSIQLNGINFQNYGISFLEPWFGGKKPNSLGVSMNYSVSRDPYVQSRISIFNTSVDFGRRLKFPDDFFRSYTTLSFRFYDIVNGGNIISGINNGSLNILSLRQTFDRTSIDAPIYPTSGSSIVLSAEATPPWSSFIKKDYKNLTSEQKFNLLEFYKIKFDCQTYLTLIRNKVPTVLYFRTRMGLLGYYNEDIGPSPAERFYLGGDGLQGFNLDGREIIALRGYSQPFIGPTNGAQAFAKFTLELRQPISLSPTATVWLHAFMEGGNAWGNLGDFNPFQLKRSAGFGVRLFLPIFGLFGVDYGWGFDDIPGSPGIRNATGGFHFMIGQQF